MLVFRFLAGLGGSAPLGIGGGVIADLFRPEERGKAIAIYSLAPLLGPAIGEIRTVLSIATSQPCANISSNRSGRWWLYCPIFDLQMGLLGNINCLRSHPNIWVVFPAGDLGPDTFGEQGETNPQGDWQRAASFCTSDWRDVHPQDGA